MDQSLPTFTPCPCPGCDCPNRRAGWLRRFGLFAFVFFLVKGLAWLAVPAALAWWGVS